MKILYGVQATGNGHICRSREIIVALKKRGHEVQVILSGRKPAMSAELEVFEPFLILRGLTFVTENGRLKHFKTALQLNFLQFYRDITSYDASGIDLVITDFEPISARIARRHGIPSIGIGHQYAFSYDVPLERNNPFGLFVLQNFAPADYLLGLHWHHFNQPILPPIVPGYLEKGKEAVADKVLVYLPFENKAEISLILRSITSHHFYIYDSTYTEPLDEGNVHCRPASRTGFLRDLGDCSAVICNAGFELTSEALHLGKRIMVKPLAGQIEQKSNALAMVQLRLGTVAREWSPDLIRKWLEFAPCAPAESADYPNVAEHIAEWIDNGRWDDISHFTRSVWNSPCNE